MPESKRQCSTCKYFQNAQLSGNGWCTHPKRQVASDVKILVRERELACRNTWGDDLWVDMSSNATTPDTTATPRREFTYLNTRLDDEVTSVVDSGAVARPAGQSQDDVVTFTSVRPDETPARLASPDSDVNSAAVADQEERARVMAKGSRHAIDSARARHARRWAPAKTDDEVSPGHGGQAEPPVTDDQVLTANHRGISPERSQFDGNSFETTGPVPRAEIEAHGALPPLPDSEPEDVRPGPKLNSSVDLPRLRNFLRPEEGNVSASSPAPAAASIGIPDTARPATTTRPPATSNFEHVIRQAERIKALSRTERAAHTRSTSTPPRRPITKPAPAIEPEPTVMAKSRNEDVVRDSADGELNMTFERARAAIEPRPAPKDLVPPPVEPRQQQPVVSEIEDDIQPLDLSAHHTFESPELGLIAGLDFQPLQVEDAAPDFASDTESSSDQDLIVDEMEPLDAWEYDETWEEEPAHEIAAEAYEPYEDEPAPPVLRDSPRGSWWRSLNFGRKRRYEPIPEPIHEYDDIDPVQYEASATEEPAVAYTDAVADDQFADDDLYWHEAPVEPASDEHWWAEELVEDEIFENERPSVAAEESSGDRLTTSDESWLMDAREFPEPQPATWRQSRTEILAQRPEPEPIAQVRSERLDPIDEVEWIEPPATSRQREQPQARRPRSERREFIPIDQPSGMDSFRDALFGGAASSGSAPAEQYAGSVTAPLPAFDEYDHEPQSRYSRREYPQAPPEPEPEPEIWDEPEYEPVAAHRAPAEPTPRRENRRGRSSRSHRPSERDADDIFDIRRAVADPDDTSVTRQLEMENGIAKCCLTCRSFQPADDAGRGWCTNSWSGTYRQMVNADTLACKSSIGNWWIAADTSWIPPSDSIQPETPRTDRLVARVETREGREPTKRSRVRTGKVG